MPFHFWDNVLVGDGCWEWQRSKYGIGYGQFTLDGKMTPAHRMAWELWNGPIPEGMLVCHHCDNPGCVRPDHLFLGTNKDNSQDMVAKGRHKEQSKTHCPQGHLLDGVRSNGKRYCRTCAYECVKAWRRKNRDAGIEKWWLGPGRRATQ